MNIINNIKNLLNLVYLIILLPAVSMANPGHLPPNSNGTTVVPTLAPMLSKATPAIVNIAVEKVIPSQQPVNPAQPEALPTKVIGVGSGIIIDSEKGYIVTNSHVVNDEEIMLVTLKDGRRYRARLIGKDTGFDLAVIQINAKHLTAITHGDSDQLKVGDFVVAIGSPFGLTQTVTSGVISALNRSEPHINNYQSFIQTDAPINPGNSGGALLDIQGRWIGVNTAIITPGAAQAGSIGIGFAIPSNMAQSVTNQLIQYGKVERGMLGVMAQNITPELADALHLKNSSGALVTDVVPGSPAAKIALQSQDIIESINGTRIHSSEQLHDVLGLTRPGTTIDMTVLRGHQETHLSATVTNANQNTAQNAFNQPLPFLAGLRLQNFSDLEPTGNLLNGLLVLSVDDISDGAVAGLQPGDIIISANNQNTPTVEKLLTIAESKPEQLLLKISRGNGQLFLVIN